MSPLVIAVSLLLLLWGSALYDAYQFHCLNAQLRQSQFKRNVDEPVFSFYLFKFLMLAVCTWVLVGPLSTLKLGVPWYDALGALVVSGVWIRSAVRRSVVCDDWKYYYANK